MDGLYRLSTFFRIASGIANLSAEYRSTTPALSVHAIDENALVICMRANDEWSCSRCSDVHSKTNKGPTTKQLTSSLFNICADA